ncbi:F0F1-type ATP synthase membrane subunit b/b' [Microbacterium testaceum]|nr:F0F1-type ATP synthase membrane subunit b/b' [Microbacterium testaceum]
MTPLDLLWAFVVIVFWMAIAVGVPYGGLLVYCFVANWIDDHRRERRAEIERTLDRKQAELRATVLALAQALADERIAADHTSEQMVARAYLSSGRVP